MKLIALFLIKVYKLCISPLIGSTCRFTPSCSDYSQEAFQRYGFLKGLKLTFQRLLKCHPWHPGGCDDVPKNL